MPVIAIIIGIFLAFSGGYLVANRAADSERPEPVKKTQEKVVLRFATTSSAANIEAASSAIAVMPSATATVDIHAEIEAVQKATGDAKAMQCAACDQFSGDAIAQCRAALGCN